MTDGGISDEEKARRLEAWESASWNQFLSSGIPFSADAQARAMRWVNGEVTRAERASELRAVLGLPPASEAE
ncbi:hypothetical protein [Cryobacterium lyxosi]|uniref:Antitoxin VbhA domain-containing protein n=1 Tax=Cryobacterium lyxosi TaxID=1259228 RepID=A0A4R8ZIY0_9MICO|nr:hypothetical protein [Cryobacterium lyxosi]TFD26634.1 hypothetical protein E3T27_07635 [Cryobacterium lyxosi]